MVHCCHIGRHGASIHETTGPPHKSPLQLAAAGGHLEVRGRSHNVNNNPGATPTYVGDGGDVPPLQRGGRGLEAEGRLGLDPAARGRAHRPAGHHSGYSSGVVVE